MRSVFPQVYVFQARTSRNLVLIATRSPVRIDLATLRARADFLINARAVKTPGFRQLIESIQYQPPSSAASSPILTDDFAPVEGLAGSEANEDTAPRARPRARP
jgi:hypothetical protein